MSVLGQRREVPMAATATPLLARVHPAGTAGLHTALVTVVAGGASGLVAGGILGRLGMRLLALTSPQIAQGRLTDDAARVGEFSLGGSVRLAVALAVAGGVLSPVYLVVRRVLPRRRALRIGGTGLLTGAVGGALLVHDHPSFDYSILQPTWLAVALFVAVPAAYGALLAFLVEWLAPTGPPRFAGPLSRPVARPGGHCRGHRRLLGVRRVGHVQHRRRRHLAGVGHRLGCATDDLSPTA